MVQQICCETSIITRCSEKEKVNECFLEIFGSTYQKKLAHLVFLTNIFLFINSKETEREPFIVAGVAIATFGVAIATALSFGCLQTKVIESEFFFNNILEV